MYDWNWNVIIQYKAVFFHGALVTLWLTFLVIICGTIFGVALSMLRRINKNILADFFIKAYIELFRALPTLVLVIWIYYVVPMFIGVRFNPFMAGLIALSLHLSAYVAETTRAGIESIPHHQVESGLVFGLSQWQTMVKIILPQALRNILPNLLSLYITELKNTSLVSIIAVNELLHQGNILISNTYRPLEIYTTIATVYLLLIIPLVLAANKLERVFSKKIKTL